MIIKEKENDLNHFNQAKKYINSNPSDYVNSLIELNKISFLIQNITIVHMRILCLLMLSKYEEIVEYYYLNRKFFDDTLNKSENEEEKSEIKKILSLGFYNFNIKQKAKQICPEIKDEYNYEIEKFELFFLKKIENLGEIKKNNSKELMQVSSTFVEILFKNVKTDINRKNLYQSHIYFEIISLKKKQQESIIMNASNSYNSSQSDIYAKMRDGISDSYKSQKENGNLITFEEKIKVKEEKIEKKESEKDNENNKVEKQQNGELIKPLKESIILSSQEEKEDKEKNKENNNININSHKEPQENNKVLHIINSEMNKVEEINIYNNSNQNDNNINIKTEEEKNKKKKYQIKDPQRKSWNVFGFVNPIEFTLSPGDDSFNNYCNAFNNGESGEDNLELNSEKNKNLIKVEIDDEKYFFIKSENNNELYDYIEYINVDFSEVRKKEKKKTTKKMRNKIIHSKSLKTDLVANEFKNMEYLEKESKTLENNNISKFKKTSIYKTNYILDNK